MNFLGRSIHEQLKPAFEDKRMTFGSTEKYTGLRETSKAIGFANQSFLNSKRNSKISDTSRLRMNNNSIQAAIRSSTAGKTTDR